MTDALTQTTAALTDADLALAAEISSDYDKIECDMLQICIKVAKACDNRSDSSQNKFLAKALPKASKTARTAMVLAGRELVCRRTTLGYGWTALAEIASLPEEHKSWAYEQQRTRQELRAFKKSLKTPTQPTTTPTTTNDLPHHPASTPQQQCVQADGWTDATVVTAEVVTMPDGEQDYQRAQELFAELFTLSKRNFKNGWTELQWNELGGKCRTLAECCDARGKRQRSRPQRQMFVHAAN